MVVLVNLSAFLAALELSAQVNTPYRLHVNAIAVSAFRNKGFGVEFGGTRVLGNLGSRTGNAIGLFFSVAKLTGLNGDVGQITSASVSWDVRFANKELRSFSYLDFRFSVMHAGNPDPLDRSISGSRSGSGSGTGPAFGFNLGRLIYITRGIEFDLGGGIALQRVLENDRTPIMSVRLGLGFPTPYWK